MVLREDCGGESTFGVKSSLVIISPSGMQPLLLLDKLLHGYNSFSTCQLALPTSQIFAR